MAGPLCVGELLGAHVGGARSSRAGLDVEGDLLAARQPIEIERSAEPVAVEEVVLAVFGGDEAKTSIRDQLLDGACGHGQLDPPNRKLLSCGLSDLSRRNRREENRRAAPDAPTWRAGRVAHLTQPQPTRVSWPAPPRPGCCEPAVAPRPRRSRSCCGAPPSRSERSAPR